MAKIWEKIYFDGEVVDIDEARLHVASSAVLYGLSVYTVFPINKIGEDVFAFRLDEHVKRLQNSAKLIGLTIPNEVESLETFTQVVKSVVKENNLRESVFARATIHCDALVPGTRTEGLSTNLSIFLYEPVPIVPQDGARLKISPWRRNPDFCIPSRAKVNGAYVNSVLAKQDALWSGYDDAIFLDTEGHVCELSAANIFIVRDGVLITPPASADILEGINRKTILEVAQKDNIQTVERNIDMTEIYIADEAFTVGTSAFVAGVIEVDKRKIGNGTVGNMTKMFKEKIKNIQEGNDSEYEKFLTKLN